MVTNKTAKRGFTLVEVIVVGVLLSILAIGAFTLLIMYTDATRETKVNLKMQSQAEALVDEIARSVRVSSFVFMTAAERASDFMCDDNNQTVCQDGEFQSQMIIGWKEDDEGNLVLDADGNEIPIIAAIREIFIRDNQNQLIAKFKFSDAGIVLMGVEEGVDPEPFIFAGDTVKVDPDAAFFELRNNRRHLRVNMRLRAAANNGEEFTLNIQRGVFRCRN